MNCVLRVGSIGIVVGSATAAANFVFTNVRWPSGETGALTMRSEKSLLSTLATSKTSKPPSPFATKSVLAAQLDAARVVRVMVMRDLELLARASRCCA